MGASWIGPAYLLPETLRIRFVRIRPSNTLITPAPAGRVGSDHVELGIRTVIRIGLLLELILASCG